ncbi:MAG: hypothetical protein QGG39_17780 [Candidatus Poribacteria bacterium]|nr:hypothetical protein [Candidatus Poribacteria bacterium]
MTERHSSKRDCAKPNATGRPNPTSLINTQLGDRTNQHEIRQVKVTDLHESFQARTRRDQTSQGDKPSQSEIRQVKVTALNDFYLR